MDEVWKMLIDEDYESAKAEIKKRLEDDSENAELWYELFLADNENYYITDLEYNNEIAYTKAIELATYLEKSKWEAEYGLYKSFPDIFLLSDFVRSIELHFYDKVSAYLENFDESRFAGISIKEKFMEMLEYITLTDDVSHNTYLYILILRMYNLMLAKPVFDGLLSKLENHAKNMNLDLERIHAADTFEKMKNLIKTIAEEASITDDSSKKSLSVYTKDGLERLIMKLNSQTGNRAASQIFNIINTFYMPVLKEYLNGPDADPNVLARYFYKKYVCTKNPGLETGVCMNVMKAVEKKPDSDIYFFAGKCLAKGIGCKSDIRKAIEYYNLAGDNSAAINNLAVLFTKGYENIIAPDPEKALFLFEHSKELGNEIAEYNVALCTYNGIGTPKNVSKGIALMSALGNKKNALAVDFLLKYYRTYYNQEKMVYWNKMKIQIVKENKEYELK